MSPLPLLSLALALLAALPTCGAPTPTSAPPSPSPPETPGSPPPAAADGATVATAEVRPVDGSGIEGTVRLTRTEGGVRVRVQLDGLGTSGNHALQILSERTCAGDPALHLGAELGTRHGGPFRPHRHLGDLGNVRADRGRGRYDRIDPALSMSGPRSPVGRAVVVRAGPDDATTQPDGAAGAVVACGVLEPGR